MTTIAVTAIPVITRAEAEGLGATEYARLAEQLRSLADEDWARPTDCPGWDVRAIGGHSVAMMDDFTSVRSVVRRMRLATKESKKAGFELVDGMTATQVAETAALTTSELIARVEELGPKTARWRANAPWWFRRIPVKQVVGGQPETWHMGFLLDTILTRDPWMHRVDVARATGRDLVLTADHDGRIVADVVVEWARRHGRPFSLTLTGPAGGDFVGHGHLGEGDHITIDAVEFCRALSGRAAGAGLLAWDVPF
jgi:uncharacterized protein (TIGR03083 family)